jgi:phospholipid/cholesterol/gamma-HCH transport system substrate-binding protein
MSRRAATIGLLAAAAAVLAVVMVAGGGSPYVIRAEFADADGLRADFAVREQGVVVGRVADVSVTARDTALATLELDRSVVPVGAGATASIHPSNLLGEKYVQLNPGDIRQPQPSGLTIPQSRTSTAPELDQVLGAFSPDTRKATAVFLAEQGDALLGRGQDLASLLQRLPSSLDSATQLVAGLGQDNVALGRLVEQSDRILQVAAPQRTALGRLVSSAQGAFTTLASREQALGETISSAPAAISQLRRTLIALQNAAIPLGPAAAGLRATAPSLAAALRATPGFATAARLALAAIGRAAPALQQLGANGTPVVSALRPAAVQLERFATTLAPVSKLLDRQIGLVLDVVQGWGRAIGDRDGIGHIYRLDTLFPQNTFDTLLDPGAPPPNPTGSDRPAARRATRGRALIATPPPPAAASVPGTSSSPAVHIPGLPAVPLPSAPAAGPPSGSAGSEAPINSLLRYLLGR